MPKSLRTYLADVERLLPNELVRITETVDPANYDCTAIVKHLDALKKFPVVVFERPLDYHGKPGPVRLVLNAEISLGKAQVASAHRSAVRARSSWKNACGGRQRRSRRSSCRPTKRRSRRTFGLAMRRVCTTCR